MAELNELSDLEASDLELLDAAGIRNVAHLAEQRADQLMAAIASANQTLEITDELPDETSVRFWISAARLELGEEIVEEEVEEEVEVISERPTREQYDKDLPDAPFAIRLPGKILMAHELKVADVPQGIYPVTEEGIEHYQTGTAPEVRIPRAKGTRRRDSIVPFEARLEAETNPESQAVEGEEVESVEPTGRSPEEDRVALIRTPREKTNRGKKPSSRRYIRGVLHTSPWSIRLGAITTLLMLALLPIAILAGFLLFASGELPEVFSWVPKWIILFPIALPVVGVAYMLWGYQGKCRICTQKLFVRKAALKHVKAHTLPGLGYVTPLCIHLLLFHWFRCSSCGTPVRLRK